MVEDVAEGGREADASQTGRLHFWRVATDMAIANPMFGVGLNAYPLVQPDLYPILQHEATGFVPHAHNLYLQTAADCDNRRRDKKECQWNSVSFSPRTG